MKFANYQFSARTVTNLGDQMQIIAIDNIYASMGIEKKDIVYLDYRGLKEYDGEYAILPVTMPMVDFYPNGFADRFSDHIIPVFIGLTMVKQSLTECEVNYLKRFAPIGCRDEYTLNTVRKYGIDAYLHGCITLTLPQRITNNGKEVFIVDVDSDLVNMIPSHIRENAIFRTQHREDFISNPKEEAKRQYDEYISNAKLVITSLLHCTVPCLAAGIPVILLRKKITYRMSWLEKIIPIYTLDNFSDVNWDITENSSCIFDLKRRVLELTIKRLKECKEKYSDICDLSYTYENRNKSVYINDACGPLIDFLTENWVDKNYNYRYSIWGLHQSAEWLVDYISDNYPNAKLCHVYDTYRKIDFRGIETEHPDNIVNYMDETVLVTVIGARKQAEELFERIGLPPKQYALFSITK